MIPISPKLVLLGIVASVGITLGTVGYLKYTGMVSTIQEQSDQIASLKTELSECKNLAFTLEHGIDQQNIGIEDLKAKNILLQEEVDESKAKIRKIRQERDKALDHLGRIPVPESCEAKFDWLIDRAQEIAK